VVALGLFLPWAWLADLVRCLSRQFSQSETERNGAASRARPDKICFHRCREWRLRSGAEWSEEKSCRVRQLRRRLLEFPSALAGLTIPSSVGELRERGVVFDDGSLDERCSALQEKLTSASRRCHRCHCHNLAT
jgi:hypothetical protein